PWRISPGNAIGSSESERILRQATVVSALNAHRVHWLGFILHATYLIHLQAINGNDTAVSRGPPADSYNRHIERPGRYRAL
ncbi:MAG: hypothetical protein KY456_08590, partial [Chloroflexi bacterium]|nr:hypothetical protein [Chloroflexota bacterium]